MNLTGPRTTQRLDATEAYILRALALQRGKAVPVDDLIPPPKWGSSKPDARKRLFRVRLHGLREKMEAAGFRRDAIESVKGGALRLVAG